MKYVLDQKERQRQVGLFRQIGLLSKLGLKFMKLLKLSH